MNSNLDNVDFEILGRGVQVFNTAFTGANLKITKGENANKQPNKNKMFTNK